VLDESQERGISIPKMVCVAKVEQFT